MPKYSIILPVKNGGAYVKECVNSILSQSYKEFNLLVLDNASTDGTLEWIQSVTDPRIIVYPSQMPLSIEENWNRIVTIPKSEFITLIGHDDMLEPNYLDTMNALIGKYSDARLYHAHFIYMDGAGDKIRDSKPMPEKETAKEFLKSLLNCTVDLNGTGFMVRSKDYDAIGGIPCYPSLLFADFELWLNILGKGYKATNGEKTFAYRIHKGTTSTSPDIKLHLGFEKFIGFLHQLIQREDQLAKIVSEYGGNFLHFYCKGLSHRLLRTSKRKRQDLSVKRFVSKCEEYARILHINSFVPNQDSTIRLALFIDRTAFGRSIFRFIKRLYPKPFIK